MKVDFKEALLLQASRPGPVRFLFNNNSLIVAELAQRYVHMILIAEKNRPIASAEQLNFAFFSLKQLAFCGDREGQFLFGFIHTGVLAGLERLDIAKYWFTLAASQNNSLAKFHLEQINNLYRIWKGPVLDELKDTDVKVEYSFSTGDLKQTQRRRPSEVKLSGIPYTLVDSKKSGTYGAIRTLFSNLKNDDSKQAPIQYIVKTPKNKNPLTYNDWLREVHFFKRAYPMHFSKLITNTTSHTPDWRFIMPLLGTMDLAIALSNASDYEKAQIMLAFLDELDRLHELKIVHGDITPRNFRVSQIGNKYFVYAIDFGFARYEGEEANSLMGNFRASKLMCMTNEWQKQALLSGKQITAEELQRLKTSYTESDSYQDYEDEKTVQWLLQHPNFAPETISEEETYIATRSQDIFSYQQLLIDTLPTYSANFRENNDSAAAMRAHLTSTYLHNALIKILNDLNMRNTSSAPTFCAKS